MSMADTRPLYERITPATRTIVTICVMLATLRGLRGDQDVGDFYVDLMRGLTTAR